MRLPTIKPPASAANIDSAEIAPPDTFEIVVEHRLSDAIDMFYLLQSQKVKPVRKGRFTWLAIILFAAAFLGWNSAWFTADGERTLSIYVDELFSPDILPLIGVFFGVYLVVVLMLLLIDLNQRLDIRAVMKRSGSELPVRILYRFEPAGVLRIEDDYRYILPWGRLHTLQTDEVRYLFVAPFGSESILIPRRNLTREQETRILEWEAYRTTQVDPSHEPCIPKEIAGEPRFDVALPTPSYKELKDATLYAVRQFNNQRNRWRSVLPIIAASALFIPASYVAVWAMDPYRLPIEIAFPLFLEMLGSRALVPTLIFVGVILGMVALYPVWWRVYASSTAKRVLGTGARSGYLITIGASGIRCYEEAGTGFYGWTTLTDFRRIDDYVYMSFGRGFIISLPVALITPDNLALLQSFAEKALAAKGVSV